MRYINGKYVPIKDLPVPKKSRYSDNSWTTTKQRTSGRFCLQAYSPYPVAKWKKQWRETKERTLTDQLKTILRDLETSTVALAALVEEGEKAAAVERKRWQDQRAEYERQCEEARRAEARKESREELRAIIECWSEARAVEAFFEDVEQQSLARDDQPTAGLLEKLARARSLIGDSDSLGRFVAWRSPEER